MRGIVFVALVLVGWWASPGSAAELGERFSRLVIFGDSLSDTGNLFGHISPNLPPPYFENRISDGPLAVDLVAEALATQALAAAQGGDNYAVVGGNVLGTDYEDLSSQVDRFLSAPTAAIADQDLFLLVMGGNDLRGLRGLQPELAAEQSTQIVAALDEQIRRLHASGARKFLVANVADVGRTPETLQRESDSPGISAQLSAYVIDYNEQLEARFADWQQLAGVELYHFDLFSALNQLLQAPQAFGFTYTEVGCFDLDSYAFHPACAGPFIPALNPDFSEFIFFDNLHPTSGVHLMIGVAMLQRLNESPENRTLPLPGVLMLLLDSE